MMKISILLAVHNGQEFLDQAISSVLHQTYQNWELIIVDNNSVDMTQKIIHSWVSKDHRIKNHYLPIKGKNQAYNFAFEQSEGEWICFFAADDLLEKTNLEKRLRVVNTETEFATSRLQTISNHKKLNRLLFPKKNGIPNLSGGSIFFSREIAKYVFPIPISLPNEDVWTALHLDGMCTNRHIDEPLYFYRLHDNNSFGYGLSFSEKKLRFIKRMEAYSLFEKKCAGSVITIKNLEEVRSFNKALKFFKEGKYLALLMMDLAMVKKLKFLIYTHKSLFALRNLFFNLFSGLIN